jgi:hypothetical protein
MLFGVAWLLAVACAHHDRGEQKCRKTRMDFLAIIQIDMPFVSCMSLEGVGNMSCTYASKDTYPTRFDCPIKSLHVGDSIYHDIPILFLEYQNSQYFK